MDLRGKLFRLKVIIGEGDYVYQKPLYEAIVYAAKKYRLSGATVVKGIFNYGENSLNLSTKVFTLAKDLPIIIELVDHKERLIDFAEIIRALMKKANAGGIITIEEVEVLYHGWSKKSE